MYTEKEKNDFITLRAEGLSFDKISQKINIPKKTLIRWNKKMIDEINVLKEAAFEELIESLKVNVGERIQMIAADIIKLNRIIKRKSGESSSLTELIYAKSRLLSELSKFDSDFKSIGKVKQPEEIKDDEENEEDENDENSGDEFESDEQSEIDFFAGASNLDCKIAQSEELRSALSTKCPQKRG
jgi:hypothetical protein